MAVRANKRFYKNVDVVTSGNQYEITLDSHKLKTPSGSVFSVNSELFALGVAHEWSSQKDLIMLSQMHLNALSNVCIDNPTQITKYDLVDSILNFLDTDTILFFSDPESMDPPGLLEKQEQDWRPIIDWFCERHSIEIEPSKSFMAPHFSPNARETVRKYLLSHSMDAIQGFTFGADSLKSLVIMSAIVNKRLTVEDAVNLGRLETQFQTDKWGAVEWHHDIELHDTAARVAAANVFFQCHTNDNLIKSKMR
jgi:ATP synthase F1 complex assembly factor 2